MKKEKEIEIVALMITKYCHIKHKTKGDLLCDECCELLEYVKMRRRKCPHGESKPFCSNCDIHCYNRNMREKIKKVMGFSAPRILIRYPIIVISHVIESGHQKKILNSEVRNDR